MSRSQKMSVLHRLAAHPALAGVRAEWEANPRLRIGMWCILGVLLWWAVLTLGESRQSLAQRQQQVQERQQRLLQLLQQTDWPDNARQAQQAVLDAEKRFWRADSRGVAQASFQSWLDEQGRRAGVEGLRARVEAAQLSERHAEITSVSASVEGVFNAESFHRLLAAIAGQPERVYVERMDVVNEGQLPRFNMVVKALFLNVPHAESTP